VKPAASPPASARGDKAGILGWPSRVVVWHTINMAFKYRRDKHRVHLIVYHLVWTPKRREAVLVGGVAADCQKLIERKRAEQGWEILELAVQADHIHLFVQAWPTVSAAEIVKECKGLASRDLRQKYPVLKRLPSLWTRSCFAATAGHVSAEALQRYIAAHEGL
jgi:putative transposase